MHWMLRQGLGMFIWQLGKQEYQDVEASNAKVVLPYDLSVPGVRVLPKGNKYSQKGVFIDACSGALALPETDNVTQTLPSPACGMTGSLTSSRL